VASIQVDLSHSVVRMFQEDLLELIHSTEISNVIFDLSGIDIMDVDDFDALGRTMSMAGLLGARCIMCGLRPGVVSAIVDLGADVDDVCAALDLDEAFNLIETREPDRSADPENGPVLGSDQPDTDGVDLTAEPGVDGGASDKSNIDPS
jgi:rsbT antagonist protein RsbS